MRCFGRSSIPSARGTTSSNSSSRSAERCRPTCSRRPGHRCGSTRTSSLSTCGRTRSRSPRARSRARSRDTAGRSSTASTFPAWRSSSAGSRRSGSGSPAPCRDARHVGGARARAGQFEIAAAWRRHLAALDPLSARYAVSFVRSLADAGDVPGALRHAHLFERLVRSELDADVGPEMRLLVAQLRLRTESTGTARRSRARSRDPHDGTTQPPTHGRQRRAHNGARTRRRKASTIRVPSRRVCTRGGSRSSALAVADVLDLLGFGAALACFGPTAAMGEVPPDVPATVAVFAFDGRATALTGELSRATAELLTASLDGGTGLTAVTVPSETQPHVRKRQPAIRRSSMRPARHASPERLGARLFVIGRIVEVGGRLRVTATMHDRNRVDPPLARASRGRVRERDVRSGRSRRGGAARGPIPRDARRARARRRDVIALAASRESVFRGRAAHGQRPFLRGASMRFATPYASIAASRSRTIG